MKFKQPPERFEPPERDDVHVASNRCPFCHEDVEARASLACQACLARHHQPCWDEGGGRCASCGGEEALVAAKPELEPTLAAEQELAEPEVELESLPAGPCS